MTIDKPGQEQRMVTDAVERVRRAIAHKGMSGSPPYLDAAIAAMEAARPTADRGEELVELRRERDALLQKPIDLAKMDSIDDEATDRMIAYYWCQQAQEARDRLILYREARDVLAELTDMLEEAFPALTHSPLLVRVRDVLSRRCYTYHTHRWGLRFPTAEGFVCLLQIAGGGRVLLSCEGRKWWSRRPRGATWEPFQADTGVTYETKEAAEQAITNLTTSQKS